MSTGFRAWVVCVSHMSVVIMAMSLYGVVLPLKLISFVQSFMQRPHSVWIAALIWLLLAVMLWFAAPASHTPTTFKVLAVLTLLAATALPLIGAARLTKVIDYFASNPPMFMRFQCLLGLRLVPSCYGRSKVLRELNSSDRRQSSVG